MHPSRATSALELNEFSAIGHQGVYPIGEEDLLELKRLNSEFQWTVFIISKPVSHPIQGDGLIRL